MDLKNHFMELKSTNPCDSTLDTIGQNSPLDKSRKNPIDQFPKPFDTPQFPTSENSKQQHVNRQNIIQNFQVTSQCQDPTDKALIVPKPVQSTVFHQIYKIEEDHNNQTRDSRRKMKQLHEAIYDQNTLLIEKLMVKIQNRGLQLDFRRMPPVHEAAKNGSVEILKQLFSYGFDVNMRNLKGQTALHIVCKRGLNKILKKLIQFSADVDAQDDYLNTPLHYAIKFNHVKSASILILNHANPDLPNMKSQTPQSLASTQQMKSALLLSPVQTTFLPFKTASNENLLPFSLKDLKIIRELGIGAFGKVYLVLQKQTHEYYALKVLEKSLLHAKGLIQFARLEKEILQKARHPFIATLKMSFQSSQRLFLALEYYPGGTMREMIYRHGPFSESTALKYLAELVLALEFLHENHIIYGDLKPENIMIDRDGHLRLIDFGLSRLKSFTRSNVTYGTQRYMAPEVKDGKTPGKSIDWYALGVIAGEMMFEGGKEKPLRRKVSEAAVEFVQRLMERRRARLGRAGAEEVKAHAFFEGVNWEFVREKRFDMQNPTYSPIPNSRINGKYVFGEDEEFCGDDALSDWSFFGDFSKDLE